MKVLIIEDDKNVSSYIAKGLTEAGHVADIANNGKDGLFLAQNEKYDVLKEIKLDDQYFAEGLTILKDKLYLLTWQEGEGFIYNLNTFEKTGSFGYNQSKEGWGLCNNEEKIFKSDGTEKIWILDPEKDYLIFEKVRSFLPREIYLGSSSPVFIDRSSVHRSSDS